jgi:DNA-binding MarR family transcriptional regulator
MDKQQHVITLLLNLIYTAIEIEQKIHNYGTDVELSSQEIYLIKIINDHSGIHVTGAAEKTGVSKAAASQMLMRLERKGLVIKAISTENMSKYVLKLTDKGKKAHKEHMRIEKKAQENLKRITTQYKELQLDIISNFLTQVKKTFEYIK